MIGQGTMKLRGLQSACLLAFLIAVPGQLQAQEFYYHTINSSSFGGSAAETFKGHFTHQLSHYTQFKLMGAWLPDKFNLGTNRVESDVYTVNLMYQINSISWKRVFVNLGLGVGGYQVEAKDLLDIEFSERSVNFVGGSEIELYLASNRLALVGEIDVLYMPFSDLYEWLWIPTGGLALHF